MPAIPPALRTCSMKFSCSLVGLPFAVFTSTARKRPSGVIPMMSELPTHKPKVIMRASLSVTCPCALWMTLPSHAPAVSFLKTTQPASDRASMIWRCSRVSGFKICPPLGIHKKTHLIRKRRAHKHQRQFRKIDATQPAYLCQKKVRKHQLIVVLCLLLSYHSSH